MAAPFVPPWLDINPLSFIDAAAKGAQIGQAQAELAQKKTEAGQQLGLGYARLGTEAAQAAAQRKDAEARLALEQNRFNLATNLGESRLGQGEQRIQDTETQHGAANDLSQQRIGIAGASQQTRQQAVDEVAKRYGTSNDPTVQSDFLAFVTDPMTKTDPQGSLKNHPGAAQHQGFSQFWKDFNPTPVPTIATIPGTGGSSIRMPVNPEQAGDLLRTNAPASIKYPRINSQDDFDKLPKGSTYRGEDGQLYQKP